MSWLVQGNAALRLVNLTVNVLFYMNGIVLINQFWRYIRKALKMDNHLMLVDLTSTERTGKDMETWLDKANITVNKNTIPNEKLSPSVTSGIRVGTPAITSRGFVESDMQIIGELIAEIAKYGENAIKPVKQVVSHLTSAHPLYE
jgi:glycine hydroxymethyltransferase